MSWRGLEGSPFQTPRLSARRLRRLVSTLRAYGSRSSAFQLLLLRPRSAAHEEPLLTAIGSTLMERLGDDLAEMLRSRRAQRGGGLTSEGASLSVLTSAGSGRRAFGYPPERVLSQSLTLGQRPFLAPRPVMRPTWPASRTKNSLSSLLTRFIVASACGRVQIWSFLPAMLSSGTLMFERSMRRPLRTISPLASLFCW